MLPAKTSVSSEFRVFDRHKISAATSHQQVKAQTAVQHQAKQSKVDADGDHDGTKQTQAAKQPPKSLSATIGQNVSTSA